MALANNDFVFDVNGVKKDNSGQRILDSESSINSERFPISLRTSMKFEFHLRYQPTSPGGGYRDITFPKTGKFEVLKDCNNSPIVHQADSFKQRKEAGKEVGIVGDKIDFLQDILTDSTRPNDIVVSMPVGDS